MFVIKRDGSKCSVRFDEITDKIENLANSYEPRLNVDPAKVAHNVITKLVSGIKTSELDKIAAQECMNLLCEHPDYSMLAGRLIVSDLHKQLTSQLHDKHKIFQLLAEDNQISEEIWTIAESLEFQYFFVNIDWSRDYTFDYFGVSTLLNGGYLKKVNGVTETPLLLFLRVALEIHRYDIPKVRETFESLARKECTHATPTLFHAGTGRNQLASCFLLQIEDSLDDMYKVVHKCALISKYGGGIGIALHKIRSSGSIINTSRGRSSGILPFLRVLDSVASHVDQGGKRPGAIAVYLEPWHPDILQFINARHPMTLPEESAPHLNYAIWMNDLFMERVQEDSQWTLFCPGKYPELVDLYGESFKARYLELEQNEVGNTQVSARELWQTILKTQIEVGMPYLLFKDACNLKSNQKNLGTIYSSNLCAEIVEHTSQFETAVCNLASVCLSSCVENGEFNFEKLQRITRMLVRNLNNVIDRMMYTTPDCQYSNESHRPIGIGVQGYADVFAMMRVSWESEAAKELTELISAHMYYAAIDESSNLTVGRGSYISYKNSPLSLGLFQFNLWGLQGHASLDWESLRTKVRTQGVLNSLCIALMPTASTSNIFGNNESIEPFTFNLYTRRTLAGEFPIMNKYLVRDLIEAGIWNKRMYERLVAAGGSVQGIEEIPDSIKSIYKTAREIKKVPLIELAAIRGRYVCQSQSLNVYIDGRDQDVRLLHNYHMRAWVLGLKTSSYYTHSLPRSTAANVVSSNVNTNEPVCESCSA